MQLRINGTTETVSLTENTIQGVLAYLSLSEEGRVIECNGQLIHKNDWKQYTVGENDVIEIIQFMGGG